ncbi:MAG: hypothetical protein JST68_29515 [Bacteroidetes bacterium]|nr:hypothetical protein [Bacteroidota bacterium]
MKQILFVSSSNQFPEGAFNLLKALQLQERTHVRGLFFKAVDYVELATLGATSAVSAMVEYDYKEIEKLAEQQTYFANRCEKSYIPFDIVDGAQEFDKSLLIKESRFADLIIISGELFCETQSHRQPNTFLHEALHAAECPAIIVPENFEKLEHLFVAYDGSLESMYAIKQFCYLFPNLTDLPTEIAYAKHEESIDMPDLDLLKKFTRLKFNAINFNKLQFKASDYFATWISEKKNALLITGSFGRSSLSYLAKPSFADEIIHQHTLPLFIAHP